MVKDLRVNQDAKNKENGHSAEKLFERYLNSEKILFYRIDQEHDTKSEEFKDKGIVRPDYIIYTKKGVFCIDVKYRKKQSPEDIAEKRFVINQHEINSLYNFQKELHQEVWLAFTDNLSEAEFYYTNISIVYEYYENIKKVYNERNYKDFSRKLIHIPESLLLFDSLSVEKGFYKKPDLKFIEEETEYHNKTNVYGQKY